MVFGFLWLGGVLFAGGFFLTLKQWVRKSWGPALIVGDTLLAMRCGG